MTIRKSSLYARKVDDIYILSIFLYVFLYYVAVLSFICHMLIRTATFVKSASKLSECPERLLPEFAMIGRSNVGKSSFINTLANNSKLSKVSVTP